MFLVINGACLFFSLFLVSVVFAFLCWRQPVRAAAAILFLTPAYLLKIGHWPITVLELFLLIFFVVWVIKKLKEGADFEGVFYKLASLFGACYFWALILILIGVLISVILSADWRIGAGIFKAWILEPIIFSLILAEIIKNKKELKEAVFSLFAGIVLVAAGSLGYKFLGLLTFDGRLTGWYLSPNYLAMSLAPGFILAWWGIFAEGGKKQKVFFSLAILILGLALYFTFSYGAWLGVLGGAWIALFMAFRTKLIGKRKIIVAGLLVAVFFLAVGSWQAHGEKLNNLLKFDRSSWQSRLMVWQSAEKILESHWLFGVGPGLFQKYYLEYQSFFATPYLEWAVPQPHNLLLAWWVQAGLLGLLGFLVLLIIYFKDIILAKQKPSAVLSDRAWEGKQLLSVFLAAAMGCILVHGLVDTTYWKNDLALIFWSIVSLNYITIRCRD